jgi:hypothetical protein
VHVRLLDSGGGNWWEAEETLRESNAPHALNSGNVVVAGATIVAGAFGSGKNLSPWQPAAARWHVLPATVVPQLPFKQNGTARGSAKWRDFAGCRAVAHAHRIGYLRNADSSGCARSIRSSQRASFDCYAISSGNFGRDD